MQKSEIFRNDDTRYSVDARNNVMSAVVVDESVGMRLGGRDDGTKTRRLKSKSGALERAKELSCHVYRSVLHFRTT